MKITSNHLLTFIVLDLLLSPILHFGIGFRISYFIIFCLGFLSLPTLFSQTKNSVSIVLSLLFSLCAISSLFVLISSSGFSISSDSIFIVFAFLFVLFSSLVIIPCDNNFLRYFPPIFFTVIIFNFFLSFLWNFLPDQILSIYFNANSLANSDLFGADSSYSGLRAWYRPLGVHGSPTYSALSVTVVFSFYVCLVRKGFVDYPRRLFLLFTVTVPLLTVLRYSSKTEIVSVAFLSFSILIPIVRRYLSSFNKSSRQLIYYLAFSILISLLIVLLYYFPYVRAVFSEKYDFVLGLDISRIFNLFINPFYTLGADGELHLRILTFFPEFLQSFTFSPLTGVGFLTSDDIYSFRYLHSDFLLVSSLSGILGLLIYLYLLYLIADFSFVLVIPIILAGLTNSFLLPFPVSGCFFLLFVNIVRLSRLQLSRS